MGTKLSYFIVDATHKKIKPETRGNIIVCLPKQCTYCYLFSSRKHQTYCIGRVYINIKHIILREYCRLSHK